ncbi:MAG: DUF2231 domain-containing protein [Pseudomonadota bacterium]
MIEPNLHPLVVHFVIGFLATAPLFFIASMFSPEGTQLKTSMRIAGDWMLALGIASAAAAVVAGFQAYHSVAHDGPSHAAMTDHRNFALVTTALFAAFGVWRLARRSRAPSMLFAILLLVPAGLLATTAWKGGRLVYHHGLGVASLPNSAGEGHDHEHADGSDHDNADDGDGADRQHDAGSATAESADPGSEPASGAADVSTPPGVVDAFSAALRAGDAAMVGRLLAPDVLIAESGGAERSFAEYQSHHMPADMEFTKAVSAKIEDRRVYESGDIAVVVTASTMHGAFRGETIHSRMMETMVLARGEDGWRIRHIHWSSAQVEGEHEH